VTGSGAIRRPYDDRGPDLSLTTTLRDAEVADGEVLELRTPGVVTRPAYVEDLMYSPATAFLQSAYLRCFHRIGGSRRRT
jgi:hypothetical protein